MKKDLRLKKPSDFRQTFKKGKRFLSPYFALYVHKNGASSARVGVSLSKIHFKLATRRNRLRRVAKETFRKEISPAAAGHDIVIASRRKEITPGGKAVTNELKQLMLEAFKQNGS